MARLALVECVWWTCRVSLSSDVKGKTTWFLMSSLIDWEGRLDWNRLTVRKIVTSHGEDTPEEQTEKVYQRKLKRRNPVRRHHSQRQLASAKPASKAMPLVYTVAERGRRANHNSMAPVTKMMGKITSFIAVQPNFSSS